MQFTSDGGVFTLAMQHHGLWEVHIPWQVAIDGLGKEGFLVSNRADQRLWLNDHAIMFSDMAASRIDSEQSSKIPDDARVTLRSIEDRRVTAYGET